MNPDQHLIDIRQVAREFNVSEGLVELAQKAPQSGTVYRDELKYRRVEDYSRVPELKSAFETLLKRRVRKGNLSALNEDQKLELAKLLDAEFAKLPPPDKTSLAIRMAQLMTDRENQAFAERRKQIEARHAALEERMNRRRQLIEELEKDRKAFRANSDSSGIVRFNKLLAGRYWAYAENFTFEGITASWNIPIQLKRNNEIKRVELMIAEH